MFGFLGFGGSRLSGDDARAKVAKGARLIDVRSPGEYASGHIPGSKNVPLDRLGEWAARQDKEKEFVLCCASGMRSARAAGDLKRAGFQRVHDLGPWSAW